MLARWRHAVGRGKLAEVEEVGEGRATVSPSLPFLSSHTIRAKHQPLTVFYPRGRQRAEVGAAAAGKRAHDRRFSTVFPRNKHAQQYNPTNTTTRKARTDSTCQNVCFVLSARQAEAHFILEPSTVLSRCCLNGW